MSVTVVPIGRDAGVDRRRADGRGAVRVDLDGRERRGARGADESVTTSWNFSVVDAATCGATNVGLTAVAFESVDRVGPG